ncbi:hypothetical protein I302_102358 [Kwoniella bestiolae CBS 10118]|uniref:Chromatin structure-remodeling complex subunit SFH1 n=1 Tax=Kwoniella bestiolae CBS 10118 TaxID=1296100 RepID=A0A1B9GEP1_9TREE|nr:hypothetical protein I302_01050 [Kwoniella bestiolae CBS 10118]OCF29542.1 hypothetical protein I302_01050 [Kwoniella bestiolae CBS 10118]
MPSKSKHEFSFPPPGWPSNTVTASRKSTSTHPGVPRPLPLNIHMVHPHSQLPAHPTNYVPHPGYQPHPSLGVHHTHPPPSHIAPSYPPANYHPIPVPLANTHYHPPPQTAYQPISAPSYRPSSYQSTPTRSSNTYSNSMSYSSRQTQNGHVPPPSRAPYTAQAQQAIYYHPQSYPPGILPYFSAPPGQKTYDVTLSTPPTSQALYTTYPSRIRTGITSLVQPEHITGGSKEREAFYAEQERELLNAQRGGSGTSTPRYDSPLPGRGAGLSTSRRGGRGRVNYAEDASDDDEDEEEDDEEDDEEEMEEPPSDPEDDNYGSRRRPGATRHSSSRRDLHSYGAGGGYGHDSQLMARANKAKRKREEMDRGWTWLGVRTPAERVRSSGARVTKHAYVSEELLEKEADRPELLVPITIDLDIPSHDPNTQGIRIKDRFLWNINEPFIEPIQFAQTFCDDLLIPHTYAATISELIKNQLEESQNTVEIDISNEDVTEEDVVWSDDDASEDGDGEMQLDGGVETPVNGDVQVNGNGDIEVNGNGVTEQGEESGEAEVEEEEQVEEEKEKVWEEADCRIIVNLDVQIYTHILRDRIEWDLSSTLPPLLFAKQYCQELGLTGEAIPQITWAIHEELLKHKKDALELELFHSTHPEEQIKFDKSGINPRTNLSTLSRRMGGGSGNGGKGLVGVWRDWFEREEYQPVLFELSFEEIIQREQERLRESRRVMRTLGGGGKRRRI